MKALDEVCAATQTLEEARVKVDELRQHFPREHRLVAALALANFNVDSNGNIYSERINGKSKTQSEYSMFESKIREDQTGCTGNPESATEAEYLLGAPLGSVRAKTASEAALLFSLAKKASKGHLHDFISKDGRQLGMPTSKTYKLDYTSESGQYFLRMDYQEDFSLRVSTKFTDNDLY